MRVRRRHTKRTLVAVALIAITTPACSGTSGTPITGCEETMVLRAPGDRGPDCQVLDACPYMRAHPDRVLTFTLDLRVSGPDPGGNVKSYTDERRDRNWTCLANRMKAAAVGQVLPPQPQRWSLTVEASYDQIRFVEALAIVNRITPGCDTKTACQQCATLPLATCETDPFCFVIYGSRLDDARTCRRIQEPVACASIWVTCGAGEHYLRDLEGACWMFGATCSPETWVPDTDCVPVSRPVGLCVR